LMSVDADLRSGRRFESGRRSESIIYTRGYWPLWKHLVLTPRFLLWEFVFSHLIFVVGVLCS